MTEGDSKALRDSQPFTKNRVETEGEEKNDRELKRVYKKAARWGPRDSRAEVLTVNKGKSNSF